MDLRAWRERGRWIDVFGRKIFAVTAGPEDAPPILVLHGFPTCSFDFASALPILSAHHRVILHDHLGFGFSEKPQNYSYSLLEQAELAIGVWRALGVTRGHLVGHDYGTSVATELVARHERGLLGIVPLSITLSNGSMLMELAQLRPAQKLLKNATLGPLLAKLSNRAFFRRQMRAILAKKDAVSDDELDQLFEAVSSDGGRDRLPAISGYIDERTRFRERWIGALESTELPAHFPWARLDPIAVFAIAETLTGKMKHATLTPLDGLGHYPMLEDPVRYADAVVQGIKRMTSPSTSGEIAGALKSSVSG